MRFSREGLALTAIATVIAFAGLRADDPWTVFPGLVISWAIFVYLCYAHVGSWPWRAFSAVIVTLIYTILIVRIHAQHLEDDQKNVSDNLSFAASLKSPDDLRSSVFKISTKGRTAIEYQFACHINLIVANKGTTTIGNSPSPNHLIAGKLEAGEDAQDDDCLAQTSVSTQLLDCADITLRLQYHLETQPNRTIERRRRYIARKRGAEFDWEDEQIDAEVSPCQSLVHSQWIGPDEIARNLVGPTREQNEKILQTISENRNAKLAAQLSLDMLDFADDAAKKQPAEPDPEFRPNIGKYAAEIQTWESETSFEFAARFGDRMNVIFKRANAAGIRRMGVLENSCHIPSNSISVWLIQNCAEGIGQIAPLIPG